MRTSVKLVRSENITWFQCLGIYGLRPSYNSLRRQLTRSESPEVGAFGRIITYFCREGWTKLAGRSAIQERVSVWRNLPGAWGWCHSGFAARQHRSHSTPYQRDQLPCRKGRPCRARHEPCRLAHHCQSQDAGKHDADLPAIAGAGTEPGQERKMISQPIVRNGASAF